MYGAGSISVALQRYRRQVALAPDQRYSSSSLSDETALICEFVPCDKSCSNSQDEVEPKSILGDKVGIAF